MPYSNVSTPRIYISLTNYLMVSGFPAFAYCTGAFGGYDSHGGASPQGMGFQLATQMFGMNPAFTKALSGGVDGFGGGGHNWTEHAIDCFTGFNSHYSWDINYLAILNHHTQDAGFSPMRIMAGGPGPEWDYLDTDEIVNWNGFGADMNGFSIMGIENNTNYYQKLKITIPWDSEGYDSPTWLVKFGGFAFGHYYDLPVSPELSVVTSREYDGIQLTETKGGSTLPNKKYSRGPSWGQGRRMPWQLWSDFATGHGEYPMHPAPYWGTWPLGHHYYSGQQITTGRKRWELELFNVKAIDLEPYTYHGVGVSEEEGDPDDAYTPNYVPETKNWFRDVLHYTKGGQLPFIFSPDSDVIYNALAYTVPSFAICKFDMDSFEREQVAPNVYNMKINIVEVW